MSDVILNVDLSQAELRVMAILSGDQWMQEALQEGQGDFFNNHMMPVCFPWIEEVYGSVDEYALQAPIQHKEDRTKVKGIQYGLAFGRSAPAIGRALGMSSREAQTIINNYFEAAPNFKQWREDVMQAAIDPRYRDRLVSVTGRRFQSEIITTKNMNAVQREALSFLPQSTSSDICLMSAMQVHRMLKESDSKARIINVVHDAVMFQVDEDEADDLGKVTGLVMKETGAKLLGTDVPFLSDYSFDKSWSNLS